LSQDKRVVIRVSGCTDQVSSAVSALNGNPGPDLTAMRAALAVVVPCYNAGTRVRRVVEGALALVDRVFVVDDGSTDGAVHALRDLPIRRITFPKNRGKGAALLAGFRAALDIPAVAAVVVVDADGQHDPAEIPALYRAWVTQRADLVIGARTFDRRNVPWPSRFGNRVTVAVTACLLKRRLPDTQSGFRLHGRRFLDRVIASVSPGRYETEMAIVVKAIREGHTLVSVPIKTLYEPGNTSSHFRKIRDSFRIYRTLLASSLLHKTNRGTPEN
jgi:glycosyltransferase involved in cell wall biosynthesis